MLFLIALMFSSQTALADGDVAFLEGSNDGSSFTLVLSSGGAASLAEFLPEACAGSLCWLKIDSSGAVLPARNIQVEAQHTGWLGVFPERGEAAAIKTLKIRSGIALPLYLFLTGERSFASLPGSYEGKQIRCDKRRVGGRGTYRPLVPFCEIAVHADGTIQSY